MKAKVTMNANWTKIQIGKWLDLGMLEMSNDIDRRAKALAPIDTSALVNSSKVTKVTDGYKISFGSSRVPYARIHELGGWTGRGHKVYIKEKHYLARGADSVARGNIGKYFRLPS